jgi:hypothetical protein
MVFGQCPTWALTTDSNNPANIAWNSEFNKDSRKLYVSGEFGESTFQIESYQLNSLYLPPDPLSSNSYLLQVDESGSVDWVKHMGKKYDTTLRGRLTSVSDGVISAFGFNDTAYVEGMEYVTDTEHILLSKFTLDGSLEWIHQIKSEFVQVASIVVDDFGSVYALGNFYDWVSVDNDTLFVVGNPVELSTEVFLAKFNPTGELTWLKYVGGGLDYHNAEALSYANGMLFGCGWFIQEMNIGLDNFSSSSFRNRFLFSMDTTGTIGWSHQFFSERVIPLAVKAQQESVLVTGLCRTPMSIDGLTINGNGGTDGFVVSFNYSGDAEYTKSVGGEDTELLDHIELVDDNLYLVSGYSNSTSFQVDGQEFLNAANEPGWYNQNHFAMVLDTELKADCMYYTESSNSSLGDETNFNHISADTIWIVSGFVDELPIGDTILYSSGGTTFIAKTCMGCDELIRLDIPLLEKPSGQLVTYPNPASKWLNINLSPNQNAMAVGMLDMLGREVLRQPFTTQLDVSHLPAGNYVLTVYTGDGVLRERVSVLKK